MTRCVRRGQVHKFENHTADDAWMLVVSTPGLFEEDYFLEVAEVLGATGDGPPDLARLLAVQARHGVIVVPEGPLDVDASGTRDR
ncbi:MAG: hypothetical protein JST73_08205 [Actinobacteria bacterium]|nr:hypothetical protein [Actinomycetota bacterium]